MEILKYRKDANSPWVEIAAIKGDKGEQGLPGIQGERGLQGEKGDKGDKGDAGENYILTEADKTEIANIALSLLPVAEEVEF